MKDRTFRSPSPHRPRSSGDMSYADPRSAGRQHDMPPVPSIPEDVGGGFQQHQRAGSLRLSSPPLRVASQKLKDGQGSWFGGAAVGDLSNVRTSDAAMASSSTAPQMEPRPSSRSSSINFSYPARVRVASPPASPHMQRAEPYFDQNPAPATAPGPAREPQQPEQQPQAQPKRTSAPTSAKPPKARPVSTADSDQGMVFDPNSRRFVPRAELLAIEREIQDVAERPRPRKKKQVQSKAGSHLAQGTVTRARSVTEHSAQTGQQQQQQHHQQQRHQQPPVVEAGPVASPEGPIPVHATDEPDFDEPAVKAIFPMATREERRESWQEPLSPSNYLPEVNTAAQYQEADSRPQLTKKPSIVREEPELEGDEILEAEGSPPSVFEALAAAPMRHTGFDHLTPIPAMREEATSNILAPTPRALASPVELPTEGVPPSEEAPAQEQKAVSFEPRETRVVRNERTHSSSPARTTHFAPIQEGLTVRHSPPPRSVSPRKSALKHMSPPRGASPSDSDTSRAGAQGRDEGQMSRKKSVRVSFDDQNTVVVGEAASPDQSVSPVPLSPGAPPRRPWYNLGIGKKKDSVSLEDDEIMKPRPALPSFIGVREKKAAKEPEERPLVRPLEPAYSPSLPDSPMPSIHAITDADQQPADPPGQSSDHALGALLAQDHSLRISANTSRFREPLPPVVTSIEGSGYLSESSNSTSESEAELTVDTPILREEESQATTIPETDVPPKPLNGSAAVAEKMPSLVYEPLEPVAEQAEITTVPSISITHPSQEKLVEPKRESKRLLDVPGSFPEDESDSSGQGSKTSEQAPSSAAAASTSAPIRQVTFEPVVQREDMAHTPRTPATVLATHTPVLEEESDESGSSIYSDAYEDLSDIEGDGFLSLDAVVESPIATSVSKSPFGSSNSTPLQFKTEPPKSALGHATALQFKAEPSKPVLDQATPSAPPKQEIPPAKPVDDWEKAKAYWRSLTADKRSQLEREAMEDAAVDADLEETTQEKKPRRKKSVEKRVAEKKAIKDAAQANHDRTYMIKPGTRAENEFVTTPVTRTSMRVEQAPRATQGPRLRKSMRGADSGGSGGGGSMIPPPTQPTGQVQPRPKAARPMSFPAPGAEVPKMHARTMSDGSPPPARGMASFLPAGLRRRGSDSSESSFRRSRPNAGGGFGFRKTMREPSSPASAEFGRDRGSRFSIRSLSPTGSPFRRSSVGHAQPPVSMGLMRTTLRDSAGPKPAKSSGSSMHFPSWGRSSRKSKPKYSSRFGDSSDEEGGPRNFHSRFDDSSDEDGPPAPLPPLNVAKTMRSSGKTPAIKSPPLPEEVEEEAAGAESPELPDSSDDDKEKAGQPTRSLSAPQAGPPRAAVGARLQQAGAGSGNIGTTTIRRSRSGRGDFAAASSPASPTSPNAHRRASLMSALRRKKGDSGKIGRGEVMDSAARRDTNLERSAVELEAMRGASSMRVKGTAGTPRLQKRIASVPNGVGRGSESWPLPSGPPAVDHPTVPDEEKKQVDAVEPQRPATSGTLNLIMGTSTPAGPRPATLQRRSMSQGVIDVGSVGFTNSDKKKKKKFATLRRLFGRDD